VRSGDEGVQRNLVHARAFPVHTQEAKMGFGKGALLWMIGIPLPIILLLALFWR
jgi:hypothetical protein